MTRQEEIDALAWLISREAGDDPELEVSANPEAFGEEPDPRYRVGFQLMFQPQWKLYRQEAARIIDSSEPVKLPF